MLRFINDTKEGKIIIGINNITTRNTFIDVSYEVNPNIRGHTDGVISFGVGIMYDKASKQKINVKSSTEYELVGVSEYIPYSLWLGYFLEHQGYKLNNNIIHQDNQSAMGMKINGRKSCTRNFRKYQYTVVPR